jgi:hypothetical protein
MVDRLSETGFKPQTVDQILLVIDAMMTGRVPLAHVLVAVREVCRVCGLGGTHQRVSEALASLAGEVLQRRNSGSDDHSDGPRRRRFGIACWDSGCWGRGEESLA